MSNEGEPKLQKKIKDTASAQEAPPVIQKWKAKERLAKGIEGPREKARIERERIRAERIGLNEGEPEKISIDKPPKIR